MTGQSCSALNVPTCIFWSVIESTVKVVAIDSGNVQRLYYYYLYCVYLPQADSWSWPCKNQSYSNFLISNNVYCSSKLIKFPPQGISTYSHTKIWCKPLQQILLPLIVYSNRVKKSLTERKLP